MSYNILNMVKGVMSYHQLIFLFYINLDNNKHRIIPLNSLTIQ